MPTGDCVVDPHPPGGGNNGEFEYSGYTVKAGTCRNGGAACWFQGQGDGFWGCSGQSMTVNGKFYETCECHKNAS